MFKKYPSCESKEAVLEEKGVRWDHTMKEYQVLIVEGDVDLQARIANAVTERGHRPLITNSGAHAINYLEGKHEKIALVLSGFQLEDDLGEAVLTTRNRLDSTLQFYHVTSSPEAYQREVMVKQFVNGYLEKRDDNSFEDDLSKLLELTLVQKIPIKKELVFFKIGGSADDYDEETSSKALRKALQYFVHLKDTGNYQVILTTGAGKMGDRIKSTYRKYSDECKAIKDAYPFKISRALEENSRNLVDLMGPENAIYITPGQMNGKEAYRGSLSVRSWRDIDLNAIFNQEKVIVIGSAPRHLGLQREIRVGDGVKYVNVPTEDSDAQTVLLGELFGAKTLGLLKRTDNIYLFDPYVGFSQKKEGRERWREIQTEKGNKPLDTVSAGELLSEHTKDGRVVSREGAWDHAGGHLFEDSALRLFEKGDSLEKIAIAHLAPSEMYSEGRHVVTGAEKPKTLDLDIRNLRIFDIIKGTDYAVITRDTPVSETNTEENTEVGVEEDAEERKDDSEDDF